MDVKSEVSQDGDRVTVRTEDLTTVFRAGHPTAAATQIATLQQEIVRLRAKASEANRLLNAACSFYCRWYGTGDMVCSPSNAAYELVTWCRQAIAALAGERVGGTEDDGHS